VLIPKSARSGNFWREGLHGGRVVSRIAMPATAAV
jgi:hypothetical protein